jgi:hypothetical protein
MLFVRRPYHLSEPKAEAWMRSQAAPLTRGGTATSVEVSRLGAPATAGGRDWDWLIELHYEHTEDAVVAAREEVCRDLVADLRLLGMQPSLVLADNTRPLDT